MPASKLCSDLKMLLPIIIRLGQWRAGSEQPYPRKESLKVTLGIDIIALITHQPKPIKIGVILKIFKSDPSLTITCLMITLLYSHL